MTTDAVQFFTSRFHITPDDLNRLLADALSKGGDYADLYFEYRQGNSLSLEETLVKSANRSISQGVGVRVNSGEKTAPVRSDPERTP